MGEPAYIPAAWSLALLTHCRAHSRPLRSRCPTFASLKIRIRREIYREFVSDLAKKYSICGIKDFDLRQVTTTDPTKDQAHKLVKWQRTAARISSLRLMLSQRLIVQKLSAENTTQKCHNCGSLEKWDASHVVWHQCKECKNRWDQDHNSVRNLLDLLCESHGVENRQTLLANSKL